MSNWKDERRPQKKQAKASQLPLRFEVESTSLSNAHERLLNQKKKRKNYAPGVQGRVKAGSRQMEAGRNKI
jgi:hypothetical protein